MGKSMSLGSRSTANSDETRAHAVTFPPHPSFPPLVSNEARAAIFGRFGYKADPQPGNPEHVRILGTWQTDNIVWVPIPQMAKRGLGDPEAKGGMLFHRLGVGQLLGMWAAWEKAGLLDRVLEFDGSFVSRFVRGSTSTLSNHCFGSAFDINYQWNKLGDEPAAVGTHGSVRELVPIANEHGFFWGGHYAGRADGMHFEVAMIKPSLAVVASSAINPLEGKPLRYLIGTDRPGLGSLGEIIEVGYDVGIRPPIGLAIGYCNLFDEKNTGHYGPYLHDSDTAAAYGEGQPDPHGPGFERNIIEQLDRRKAQGFHFVELDNPDAYRLEPNIRAITLAEDRGLGVVAKNVGLGCNGEDADAIVAHPNVFGIIVEKGAGTPSSMDRMRLVSHRQTLPCWFVFFGDTRSRAQRMAKEASNYRNMYVTISRKGEYETAEIVQA